MTPPMPPAPLARMPLRGSLVARSNGKTKAPLSWDGLGAIARGSPVQAPRAGGLIAPVMSPRPLSALARDQPGEHVLAEGKIGGSAYAPHRHDHQRADHDPKGDRSDAQLASGMDEPPARPPRRCGALRPAGMIAMVVLCRRPSRHSRFPAGSVRQPTLRAR